MSDTLDKIKCDILSHLDSEPRTFEDIVKKLDAEYGRVEDAVRWLLQRQYIGETSDWKFFITIAGEKLLESTKSTKTAMRDDEIEVTFAGSSTVRVKGRLVCDGTEPVLGDMVGIVTEVNDDGTMTVHVTRKE